MKSSARLLAFLEEHEAFRPTLYNDEAGHATIGYGHLVHTGPVGSNPTREALFVEGITRAQAAALLTRDIVVRAESAINALVHVPLTQNQYDVLVSFVFNIGAHAFEESTLLRVLNDRKYDAVPSELTKWHYEHKVPSLGLARRRAAEAAWWKEA